MKLAKVIFTDRKRDCPTPARPNRTTVGNDEAIGMPRHPYREFQKLGKGLGSGVPIHFSERADSEPSS